MNFFRELSHHRKLLVKESSLFELLSATLDVSLHGRQCFFLQKEFLITEVGMSYLHFGISFFSRLSMILASKGLYKLTGLDPNFVFTYLDNLKKFLLEENNLLSPEDKIESSNLESVFAKEFVKRIYTTDSSESIYSGMLIFCEEVVGFIKELSKTFILQNNSGMNPGELNQFITSQLGEPSPELVEEFFSFADRARQDFFVLLMARLESFLCFYPKKNNHFFVSKLAALNLSETSKSLSAILSALLPHKNLQGKYLIEDGLVSLNQLTQLFNMSKGTKEGFDLSLFKSWLGLLEGEDLKFKLEQLLTLAVEAQVVFRVPKSKGTYAYGISEKGSKILRPYQSVLTESILC